MASISLVLKRFLWAIFLCIAITSFPLPSLAVTVQDVPNPRQVYGGWVTDMVELLDSETKAKLNQIISALEAENGTEIAIVTVPDTAPSATPKQFATQLFKYWGIGKKDINNGVLFLISQSDRRVEIETGYGIEPILPNFRVREIINQDIISRFKQDDFAGGILVGTQAIIEALRGYDILPLTARLHQRTTPNLIPYFVIFGGLVLLGFGAIVWAIVLSFRPTFVEPEGRSRKESAEKDGVLHCTNCRQPMEKLPNKSLLPYLSQPEQIAKKISSISFEGWRCPTCQPNLKGEGIHIRAYVLDSRRFIICPTCQELTVERTSEFLEPATYNQNGKRLVTEKCHCCSYCEEREELIVWSDYSYSSYGDSGSGTWGGDSGGFGGGDSGGGGDGGGW